MIVEERISEETMTCLLFLLDLYVELCGRTDERRLRPLAVLNDLLPVLLLVLLLQQLLLQLLRSLVQPQAQITPLELEHENQLHYS